jgi:ribosomal 50S subunit-recycling heat shock protein
MRIILNLVAAAALSAALPVAAQKSGDVPKPQGGTVVASEPGKAAVVRAAELSALVVSIDKKTRTISLKGPKGNVVDVVAGDDVQNFEQIKVGDFLKVRFMQALALELQKTKSGASGIATQGAAVKAEPGQRPAVAAAGEVTAIAKVTNVNPKAKTITLKGPRGNEVALDVQNPDQFKVVKVGDEVKVTYTEAVAISVEPATKAAPKKK